LPPEVRDENASSTAEETILPISPMSLAPASQGIRTARTEPTPSPATAPPPVVTMSEGAHWRDGLATALSTAIRVNESAPGDRLTREFEETMIRAALAETKGRRIEASVWLGWGRNTLTRKIHELGLDDQV
jgi:two-component system, NtrC family, nitrogen regulation response regulator GlnG